MEKNIIEKYELIDGHAIIDTNYNIITANEEMYRFIGISTVNSIMESIHQVDLDDFIDVAHHLREGQETDMVLRMRRSDNSYRWILLHIARFQFISTSNAFEYFELSASDILALHKQNEILQNNMQSFRHLLAMENELFFIYDYKTHNYKINNFIDNEIHTLIDMDVKDLMKMIADEHLISEDTMDEYNAFIKDMEQASVSYTHSFKTNILTKKAEYDLIEVKVTTIYINNKPSKAVGSIRNLTNAQNYTSINTYNHESAKSSFTSSDIYQFCRNNILYNPKGEFTLILLEIDNFDKYEIEDGKDYADSILYTTVQTAKQMVSYRGIVCEIKRNLICIAIRDINAEVSLRAFLEALRNQISWNVLLMNSKRNITFSIGISRYPQNGSELEIVNKKLYRAMDIVHERGRNRYIIYREHLHGDIS